MMIQTAEYLAINGCRTFVDYYGCQKGVRKWWPSMAKIIFVPDGAAFVCNEMDSECTSPE